MKKLAIILCVTFVSILAHAQIRDNVTTTKEKYLKVLCASNWTMESWFDKDTVKLTPIVKPELVTEPDTIVKFPIARYEYGMHFAFDSAGRFNFEYAVFCPVGMTMYDVQSFRIKGKKVYVEYCSYVFGPEPVKEYKSTVFKITDFSSSSIVMKRKK